MTIKIQALLNLPVEQAWSVWTQPQHIIHWNFASPEWFCLAAINDLQPGGRMNWRMEARDKSAGFDFTGRYLEVIEHELIKLQLDDNRMVMIEFTPQLNQTLVTETFEAESENPVEMQKAGWQAILDNYKSYAESI